MTPEAFKVYYSAVAAFDRNVREARAALVIREKEATAAFDPITASLADDVAQFILHDQRQGMELRLTEGHGHAARRGWAWLLPQLRANRLSADRESLEGILGPSVDEVMAEQGIRVDPADLEGRAALIWAVNAKVVGHGEEILSHLNGFAPPIPPKPERPNNPKGGARTVSALCDAYRAAKWEGWSESSRRASVAVLRVLQDTIGGRDVTAIDRDTAREVFETVKALPVNMSKRKELRGLKVPEAVEEAKRLAIPTIAPKTINDAYMVHIAAIFKWAVAEDWAVKNPFVSLSADDPVDDRDRREPFSLQQLKDLFSADPWAVPLPSDDAKPGRYWVPLIALYSGMRLGEIAGLRIMDIEKLEGVRAFRVRPYEGRTLKTKDSRRDVPVHSALVCMGFLAYVARRLRAAKPGGLLFPDAKASGRGYNGAKLGERFSGHLKAQGIVGTKLGMHSFRHNFEDRLKAVGLHGRAEGQALGGRKVSGSEGSYGSEFPIALLRDALEKVNYPGLDLSHLRP